MFHVEHEIEYHDLATEDAGKARELFRNHKSDLSEYIDRLMWWNKKVNLVSRDVPRETITKHVEHSLSLVCSDFFKEADRIIDTGTGGGLPGIPLAITHPRKEILLNDIVSKKIMACKHMASGIGLKNISGSSASIEDVLIPDGSVILSKHAFKINNLVELLGVANWGAILLLKGGNEVESELKGIKESLRVRIIDLEKGFNNSFYKGKSMVEISKKG